MKVSIITATYNSENTIRDTLESVANQTHNDIEHIIVDGGSTDKTIEIVKEYPHVSQAISEKDTGIYDAMNKGITWCTGDIIGILNSDDYYIGEDVIKEVHHLFENDKSLLCMYADLEYVSRHNPKRIVRKWKSGILKPNSFALGWMPPHPTFFVRREIYKKYGVFNLELGTAADYELLLRLLGKYKCKCAYLPQTIINMRTGGASNNSLVARWKAHQFDKMAWKVNGLKPRFYTFILKPLRKVCQYF